MEFILHQICEGFAKLVLCLLASSVAVEVFSAIFKTFYVEIIIDTGS
nr:hypothetical protein [Clostridioides difficile]